MEETCKSTKQSYSHASKRFQERIDSSDCRRTQDLEAPWEGASNTTLQWDWLCYGCHFLHNVVKAGLDCLKNNAANPTQAIATLVQEALDRSVLLSFHCIAAKNDLSIVLDEHVCHVLHS